MPEGKVFIAGSGPGNAELITEKARKLIKEVDVILYDELIGEELRKIIENSGKEAVDVGKRVGKHKKKQEEINRLLVEYAKKGKKV
ncbi:MAG TPA: uroporphyrin-III C-methyltransferase, partial [Archaeoglobaceae archaeon]|nr:uroporphyrin-III C-methyltransferase [Archaeoglobaceae archaeon]